MKLTRTKTRRFNRSSLVFIVHGPGLVRIDQSSWRTWNGLAFRGPRFTYWFEVR